MARRALSSAAAVVAALAWTAAAHGHGTRLPFAVWGGFQGSTLRCQRVIARAASECAEASWSARRTCRSAELAGGTCDEAATQAVMTAARNRSLDLVDAYCSERQLADLQFLGQFDLQADLDRFCRDWETAATSAVYDAAAISGAPTEPQRACIGAAAHAVDGAMRFTFRNRRQCMDRIAALPTDAAGRSALLDLAERRNADAGDALAARLAARCGDATFTALYGRAPGAFMAGIGVRADCLGGQFYIQDAVLCPAAVCGNGIVEPGEDCDDGNTADGDACPADCL